MKIKFAYSYIYDIYLHFVEGKQWNPKLQKSGEAFARKMQKLYNKNKHVFNTMSKVSRLKWKEKEVKVYCVHNLKWDFSDPVTLKVRKNMDDALETFIHEMSHQLLYQNKKRIRKNPIGRKYARKHRAVRHHILEHAILYKTYLKFYGTKRTNEIIEEYGKEGWKWHYEAWQIVLKEGADNILKMYIK